MSWEWLLQAKGISTANSIDQSTFSTMTVKTTGCSRMRRALSVQNRQCRVKWKLIKLVIIFWRKIWLQFIQSYVKRCEKSENNSLLNLTLYTFSYYNNHVLVIYLFLILLSIQKIILSTFNLAYKIHSLSLNSYYSIPSNLFLNI